MATDVALLRGGLQVLPLGSDGQCRSAECGWPTAPRSGKPCHRTHRTGALAPQSRKPWDGTPFLTRQPRPARDRTESRGKGEEDETKPEARPGLLSLQDSVYVWGGDLTPWAATAGPGRSRQVCSMGAEKLVTFGRSPWLEKVSQSQLHLIT